MERPIRLHEEYYAFERSESDQLSYFFRTVHQVEYKVVFKPASYVFGEDKPYASLLYEFSLLVQFSGPDSYRRDDLIAPTVAFVFLDFYNRNNENICLYICDSSDGKHHVRARMFNIWFRQYNRGAFSKFDSYLVDTNGDTVPVSIILASDNVYWEEINAAFFRLIKEFNDQK